MLSLKVLRRKVTHQAYKVGHRLLPPLFRPRGRQPKVLLYHEVEEQACPLTSKLGHNVTPRHFEEHVHYLTATHRVVPFSRIREEGSRPGTVALTFDDGARSILTNVVPIIEKFSCPIKVYLTTNNLTGINWLNKLSYLLNELPPEGRADLARAALDLFPGRPAGPTVRDFIDHFDVRRTAQAVEEFFAAHHKGPVRQLYLSEEEVRRLAAHPLVEFGSHTRNHYPLPRLPQEQLEEEVVSNHQALNRLFDNHIQGFAIPFGFRTHRTEAVAAAIHQVDAVVVSAYGGLLDFVPYNGVPEVKRISAGGNLGSLWYRMSHPG
jgi:peptidoglycan/xylan/chitin deacetylase (PgdA/CDA1 family)